MPFCTSQVFFVFSNFIIKRADTHSAADLCRLSFLRRKQYDKSFSHNLLKGRIYMSDKNENKAKKSGREIIEWADSVAISVLCVVLLFTFVFRMVGVKGTSMQDTLQSGDKVIIYNLFYTPKAGDIVVISRADLIEGDGNVAEPIIKRVIATEGQTINFNFDTGAVYVDGQKLDEPYIKDKTIPGRIPMDNPYTVPAGHVFVMGDHRSVSKDSRTAEVGAIDTRYILGKAVFRLFPTSEAGVIS